MCFMPDVFQEKILTKTFPYHLVLVQEQRDWLQFLFGPVAKDFLITYVDVEALTLYVSSGLYTSASFCPLRR